MHVEVYQINGTSFKKPSSLQLELFRISNLDRLASGYMVGQMLPNGRKRKFYFKYDAITGSDLDHILDLIWEGPIFFTLTYTKNNVQYTANVYPGSIPFHLHSAKSNEWVWKDLTFDLIER
jgi:hypothetical protein